MRWYEASCLLAAQILCPSLNGKVAKFYPVQFITPYYEREAIHFCFKLLTLWDRRRQNYGEVGCRLLERKGVHLDIEYLPPEFDLKLVDFLNELRTALREKKMKLTFAVFPQIDFPANTSKLHNVEKLASAVDEVVLMSYDYHNKKTEAGCVTSLEWTKKNITHLLKYFKLEQVWLGMPSYGYEWVLDSKKVNIISSRDGQIYEKKWEGTRENSGCLKILREEKKKTSMIFLADQETRNKMKEIAEEFKIRGTAIWRLGLEEKEE